VTVKLRKDHRLIREVYICFVLEGAEAQEVPLEPVLPAAPSVDADLLSDLIALRMEGLRLPADVAAIRLGAETTEERSIQAELFTADSRESRKAVDRVFARFRGTWGNDCVQRARLEDEHFPERSYSWEDLRAMPGAKSCKSGMNPGAGPKTPTGRRCSVRRIFAEPCPPAGGGFARRSGLYPLSGRWWLGEEPRIYAYGESRSGEILWLYRERSDGQWLQIGLVE
jgi:hypothetical protein